jgi:hypothetical protein
MFEDIHKIDSTVFKPDPTKSKSDRDGRPRKRFPAKERKNESSSPGEIREVKVAGAEEENQESHLLDIRV